MIALNNAYDERIELTEEQEKCLNYHLGKKTLMIKGYAGAGKSLVLQTTALKYINKYPENMREHKIAVFTFTNALIGTTRELLDANPGGKDVFASTLDSYLLTVYRAMGGPYKKMYWGQIRQDNIKQALINHAAKHGPHRFHDLPIEFWEAEIDWMKGMNVSVDDEDYYLSLPRRGRGSGVRMSREDRRIAFQIFESYCSVNDRKNCGDWSDHAIYINRKLRDYFKAKSEDKEAVYPIPKECMFDMVLIDEAQDLSLAQMLAVMGLYNKAMIVAMDAHQRIYAANWTAKQLGIETQTQWLKKSMRNTIEIDALAESLRKRNEAFLGQDNMQNRAIPVRHGSKPIICGLNNSADERTFILNQIKTWQSESSEIRIGLIAATKKQVEKYSIWCADEGIYHEIIDKDHTFSMKTPGVKILNAYNAKGLEFFRVIIPEFNEGYFPFRIKTDDPDEEEAILVQFRSLAYVAMTRAQETLLITYSVKKPSRFIEEMDSSLFDRKGSIPKTNTYKTVRINNNKHEESERKIPSPPESDPGVNGLSLKSFFEEKGFKCVDKRTGKAGSLWVIGTKKELTPIVREAKRLFGDLGNNNFSEHGGRATGHQPAWFLTSNK